MNILIISNNILSITHTILVSMDILSYSLDNQQLATCTNMTQ